MTYSEVLAEVCRVSNWLKQQGVKAGDAVAIYMPMVVQLPIAMLACARIGAVHSVVFGGFSAEALADRIVNCEAKVLITASGVMRGTKAVQLKKIADEACNISKSRNHEVRCYSGSSFSEIVSAAAPTYYDTGVFEVFGANCALEAFMQ